MAKVIRKSKKQTQGKLSKETVLAAYKKAGWDTDQMNDWTLPELIDNAADNGVTLTGKATATTTRAPAAKKEKAPTPKEFYKNHSMKECLKAVADGSVLPRAFSDLVWLMNHTRDDHPVSGDFSLVWLAQMKMKEAGSFIQRLAKDALAVTKIPAKTSTVKVTEAKKGKKITDPYERTSTGALIRFHEDATDKPLAVSEATIVETFQAKVA